MKQKKNILLCPLEWGLGHSGRTLALAKKLYARGNNIFIGAGKTHLAFFRKELQGVSYIEFPGYSPHYSRFIPPYLKIFFDIPVLIFHLFREHKKLKQIVRDNEIDIVISDNRFGLWNRKVRTVYMTHMPRIPFPRMFRFLEFTGILFHRLIIKQYDLCFIPDIPGENNLSGRLSHGPGLPSNVRYTGILSRFTDMKDDKACCPLNISHDTVILSGPEPHKSMLRDLLSDFFRDSRQTVLFLGGKPDGTCDIKTEDNIMWCDHLESSALKAVLETSAGIIARSGYSTVMELVSLGRSATLIPTPGQPEQEYLAEHLSEKGWVTSIAQNEVKLGMRFSAAEPLISGLILEESSLLLDRALDELLENK